MSVRVMQWVWEHSRATGIDRLVLLAIADNANDDGGNAYPGMATLMAKTRLPRSTIYEAIRRLIALGELERTTPSRGRHRTVYRVMTTVSTYDNRPEDRTPQPSTSRTVTARQPSSSRTPTVRELDTNRPAPGRPNKEIEPSLNRPGTQARLPARTRTPYPHGIDLEPEWLTRDLHPAVLPSLVEARARSRAGAGSAGPTGNRRSREIWATVQAMAAWARQQEEAG